jgi:hypothetical protein
MDNNSAGGTREQLRTIGAADKRVIQFLAIAIMVSSSHPALPCCKQTGLAWLPD